MRFRHLALLSVAVIGAQSFLLTPRGEIAPAEGCSGAGPSPTCVAIQWTEAKLGMASEGVVTNSPLLLELTASETACQQGATGAKAQVEVLGPDGAPVEGGPAEVVSADISGQTERFVWLPKQPLAASSKYTLRVQGLAGGQAVDLPFTTAAGPYLLTAAAPQATLSTFDANVQVCCEQPNGGFPCGPSSQCSTVTSHARAFFSFAIPLAEVPESLWGHTRLGVEKSEGGAAYTLDREFLLAEVSGSPEANLYFDGKQGPFCMRLVRTSTLDGQSTTSEPFCEAGDAIDFSDKPGNCQEIQQIVSLCQPLGQAFLDYTDEASQAYTKLCGGKLGYGQGGAGAGGSAAAGSAGQGGADEAGAAGSAGATVAGSAGATVAGSAGATVAGGAGAPSAGAAGSPEDPSGCHLSPGPKPGRWALGLLALLALGARTKRRRVAR